MNGNGTRSTLVVFLLAGLVTLAFALAGQQATDAEADGGLPTDWSHRHLIFSQPGTPEQAMRVQQDPRYRQQWYRRHQRLVLPRDTAENQEANSVGLLGQESTVVGRTSRKLHRDWSENLGSLASAGAANFPAKFAFLGTTAKCGSAAQPDYVVYSTGLAGSSTQASIVAYDNLYSGCTGIVPSTYWALNTGGAVLTSPALSGDGTQLAFVQTAGGIGTMVMLRWAASSTQTVTSPGVPTSVSAALYHNCTPTPCMTTIILRDGSGVATDDTTSSVFYDYATDTAWVGGARGWLHKITNLFKGAPAEVRTGGWPVQVNPGNPNTLATPVYDGSGNVFVGDAGGFLYRVNASTAAVTATGQLDHAAGIVDIPFVDATAGVVYVFASNDGSTACTGGACAVVYRLTTGFAAGTTGSKVAIGGGSPGLTPTPQYDGDFDSTYLNSPTATGNIYVCGNPQGNATLYQVSIVAGVLGTVNTGPVLTTAHQTCSPVTDFLNPNASGGATEWIFLSVQNTGVPSACGGQGCIMNFRDTPWNASSTYSVGQEILDSHFQIQVVSVAGTSGGSTPTWSVTTGGSTTDGTVTWLDQGPLSASAAGWQANFLYTKGTEILDSNNNIELVTTGGRSGATTPIWSTTVGATTADQGVRWLNLGPIATSALRAAGGTSGIIIDNTVGSGTLAGASEVYFTTLANQTCVTSGGTGGCAVQASQAALK